MFTKVVKGDKGVWERELDSAQTRRDRVSSFAGVTRSFSECVCVRLGAELELRRSGSSLGPSQ